MGIVMGPRSPFQRIGGTKERHRWHTRGGGNVSDGRVRSNVNGTRPDKLGHFAEAQFSRNIDYGIRHVPHR